jgi:hypothetical protein
MVTIVTVERVHHRGRRNDRRASSNDRRARPSCPRCSVVVTPSLWLTIFATRGRPHRDPRA